MRIVRVVIAIACFVVLCTAASAGEFVPMKGTLATTAVITGPCAPPDGGPGLQFVVNGGGYVTHLGAVTDMQSHCLSLSTFMFAGGATMTAPDGSSVSTSYVGQAFINGSGNLEFYSNTTVTGGTRRFAGAAGTGTAHGEQVGDLAVVNMDGNISSVGSTK